MGPVFVSGKSTFLKYCGTDLRMALMELRILVSALIMNYTWTGVPDVPGKWEEEMKPRDAVLLVPWKGKCVVDIKERRKS